RLRSLWAGPSRPATPPAFPSETAALASARSAQTCLARLSPRSRGSGPRLSPGRLRSRTRSDSALPLGRNPDGPFPGSDIRRRVTNRDAAHNLTVLGIDPDDHAVGVDGGPHRRSGGAQAHQPSAN